MDVRSFARTMATASSESERVAWFGALLTKEAGLDGRLVIVGGSAIEVYLTSDRYVSYDIDVVGDRGRIVSVLEKWGFEKEMGRSGRVYWSRLGVGKVNLVGATDKSGLPPRRENTPYGPVLLGPVEFLIVRRLVLSAQECSVERFNEAAALAIQYHRSIDWEYVAAESKYEKVLSLYRQLRKMV